jgi:hypothetical protein
MPGMEEKMNRIWVIEMLFGKRWVLQDTYFSREGARIEKRAWEKYNPDDRYRIRKYVDSGETD